MEPRWHTAVLMAAIIVPSTVALVGVAVMQSTGDIFVDDRDSAYAEEGGWRPSPDGIGFRGSEHATIGKKTPGLPANPGDARATWTVGLPDTAALYDVFVTWETPASDTGKVSLAAPFSVTSGPLFERVTVDQTKQPSGPLVSGRPWRLLGTFTLSSVVTVALTNDTSGVVLADALLIRPAASADVSVSQSLNNFQKSLLPVFRPGSPMNYTIMVQNFGTVPVTNISVTDLLPVGFVPDAALDKRCVYDSFSRQIRCTFSELLSPGKRIIFFVKGTVSKAAVCGTSFVNVVTVSAAETEAKTVNNRSQLLVHLCGVVARPPASSARSSAPSASKRAQKSSAKQAISSSNGMQKSAPLSSSRSSNASAPKQKSSSVSSRSASATSKSKSSSSLSAGPVDPPFVPGTKADIALRIVSRATVKRGEPLSSTVEVTNKGPGATPAFLEVTLPEGSSFLAGSVEGCRFVSPIVGGFSCTLGSMLPRGEPRIVRFSATTGTAAACGSKLRVHVRATLPAIDEMLQNNTVLSDTRVVCP